MTELVPKRKLQSAHRGVASGPSPTGTRSNHFSCAPQYDPMPKRLIIRAIETMTGRRFFMRLYDELRRNPVPEDGIWSAAMRILDLKVDYNEDALARLPKSGPCVIVANHPFGVLDGLIIAYLTSRVRNDFVILTSGTVFNQADEIRSYLLPIDFPYTKETYETNITSREAALRHLSQGGALVMFPAGKISSSPNVWSKLAVDAQWKNFAARLIVSARAPVVPIYIAGQNSRLFQIASHISARLRLSLFFKELYDKVGTVLRVQVGEVIPYSELEGFDRAKLMEHLRRKTYDLRAGMPDQKASGRDPMLKTALSLAK
jgi:putative hemolysin